MWKSYQLNNIIHIKKKNQDMRTSAKDKHGWIDTATHKTMRQKKTTKMVEPRTKSLLQIIESFLKFANIMRIVRVCKPPGLFHINFLSKMVMQEDILDV